MKKENIKSLYEMLYNFNKIAENNNLKYFLIGLTLDSIIKYKGIISNENKVYVGIFQEGLGKILNITSLFGKCGYVFKKPKNKDEKQIYSLTKGEVSIIMVMFQKWGKNYKIEDWEIAEDFPNSKIKKEDLLPLKKIQIGELCVSVPKKSNKYLKQLQIQKNNNKAIKPEKIKKNKCVLEKKLTKNQLMEKIPIEKLGESENNYKDCTVSYNGKETISFYVNCGVHKKRRKKFLKHLKEANGVKSRREPCVNGKEITNNLVCQMVKYGFVSKRADVNPIEIAIFLSHYNIWIKLLNSKADYALVFEDDSEIDPQFKSMLNKTLKKLEDHYNKPLIDDVLFLWNGNWNKTAKYGKDVVKVDNKINVFQETHEFTPGTVSYLITKKFAKKLVDNSFPIRNSVDVYMGEQPFRNSKKDKSVPLSIKMYHNKEKDCYLSPFFTGEDWVCGGDWGTGDTTQNYEADKVEQINCKKIK